VARVHFQICLHKFLETWFDPLQDRVSAVCVVYVQPYAKIYCVDPEASHKFKVVSFVSMLFKVPSANLSNV
jgi:hypothetical protein